MIGGGSWATALVKIFAGSGRQVFWYLRKKENVQKVIRLGHNPNYLSYLSLPMQNISPSADLEEVIQASNTILIVVPSAYLPLTISALTPEHVKEKQVITSIKGTTGPHDMLPSHYIQQALEVKPEAQALLAGPCHAEEIALGRKTYMTVASKNKLLAASIAAAIELPYIHTQINLDPDGIEYAAIYKNIIGLACGIAKGLNYGDNFQAVIVSNAIHELQLFLHALSLPTDNIAISAYLGDLLVTAYSTFSRNRSFGEMIGRGYSIQMAKNQMNMVAEGYYAVKGIYQIARQLDLQLPIVSAVFRILHNHMAPYIEFKLLENKLI